MRVFFVKEKVCINRSAVIKCFLASRVSEVLHTRTLRGCEGHTDSDTRLSTVSSVMKLQEAVGTLTCDKDVQYRNWRASVHSVFSVYSEAAEQKRKLLNLSVWTRSGTERRVNLCRVKQKVLKFSIKLQPVSLALSSKDALKLSTSLT